MVNCGSFVDAIIADPPSDHDPCNGLQPLILEMRALTGFIGNGTLAYQVIASDFSDEENVYFSDSGTYEVLLIANWGTFVPIPPPRKLPCTIRWK